MKINHILFTVLFISLGMMYSCSTEEEEPMGPDPTPGMMDDMDDDDSDLVDAPAFALQTTEGDNISSAQFEGKNLVIFFFGFNCPPCKAVGPNIQSRLYDEFKDKENFAIIGADQWEGNKAGVESFQNATGITFPLGMDGASMAKDFGTTYDRLVVVNANGKIAYKGNSIASNNLDEVVDLVRLLVN